MQAYRFGVRYRPRIQFNPTGNAQTDRGRLALSDELPRVPYILTLHGVGIAKPGSTLVGLAKLIEHKTGAAYSIRTRVLSGNTYSFMESDRAGAPILLEINWSDIRRSANAWYLETWHVPKLLIAMLHLCDEWPGGCVKSWPLSIYKFLFELSIWTVPYIVYVMLLASMSASFRLPFAASFSVFVFIISFAAWRWSTTLGWIGFVSSFYYLAMGVKAASSQKALQAVIEAASRQYAWRHQSFPFMILILFLICLLFWRHTLTLEQRLARFMLAYIPFLSISIWGALLWIISIPVVSKSPGYSTWSTTHLAVLEKAHYNLALTEFTHLGAILLLGGTALGVAGLYGLRVLTGWGRTHPGQFCRNAVPWMAWLVPAGMLAVAIAVMYGLFAGDHIPSRSVFSIYRISALRIVPFLPWLVTPMRVVVDVLGDIIFTVLPPRDRLSVQSELLRRTTAAFDYVHSANPSRIVLLSHSLGTVFAAGVVGRDVNREVSLCTTGSPLSSLHARFLGFRLSMLEGCDSPPRNWVNLYRVADYIGGPIDVANCQNVEQSTGGHIGYWTDERVLKAVWDEISEYAQVKAASQP
jgi:hypothetical protein